MYLIGNGHVYDTCAKCNDYFFKAVQNLRLRDIFFALVHIKFRSFDHFPDFKMHLFYVLNEDFFQLCSLTVVTVSD